MYLTQIFVRSLISISSADQFKQRVRGLVGFPTNIATTPSSNRMDASLQTASYKDISVISKPAVLHEKSVNGSQNHGKLAYCFFLFCHIF